MSNRVAIMVVIAALGVGSCRSDHAPMDTENQPAYGLVYGVVTAPNGVPVAGASVQMRENLMPAAVTSPTGQYRLSITTTSLFPLAQTVLFTIAAPPSAGVRDTTVRHTRISLYDRQPVSDSNAVSFVADARQ